MQCRVSWGERLNPQQQSLSCCVRLINAALQLSLEIHPRLVHATVEHKHLSTSYTCIPSPQQPASCCQVPHDCTWHSVLAAMLVLKALLLLLLLLCVPKFQTRMMVPCTCSIHSIRHTLSFRKQLQHVCIFGVFGSLVPCWAGLLPVLLRRRLAGSHLKCNSRVNRVS